VDCCGNGKLKVSIKGNEFLSQVSQLLASKDEICFMDLRIESKIRLFDLSLYYKRITTNVIFNDGFQTLCLTVGR
jgi:hypothetical protein